MKKKQKEEKQTEEKQVVVEPENAEETEILEETKELENDTKLNNEMLKLEKEIQTLTEENKALVEKVKLSQAELVNYRRRKDEETASILKYANQDILTELVPIVDNFERALAKDESKLSDDVKKYLTGFKLMYANMQELLKKFGVEEINRVGQVFDPTQEQALLTDNNPELEDDVVTEVLLKGYKLKDRVIRPASVKINQL